MTTSNASPQLTLRVRAPEALQQFRALRMEADALRASLAALHSGGSNAGVARLQAEVKELRAALTATRLEVTNLQAALEAQTKRAEMVLARQTAQVKQHATQQRAAKKQALDGMDRDSEAASRKQSMRDVRDQQRIAAMAGRYRQQAFDAVGAARGRTMDPRLLIGLQSTEQATRASNLIKQQMQSEAAMTALHSAALVENARRTAALTREKEKVAAAAGNVTRETKKMSDAQNIARSTARGVSGALGGLWLTYGQVLPALAAGFAATVAIRETLKRGAQFSYQMQFVGALGERSPADVTRLGEEVLGLSRDALFGPVELAKGLRVLEQAGLDADDSLKVLSTTMRVALQGEVDLTKASELLVGVMNEFGLAVNDIPRIGDVLSKVAADTPSSLMQIGEAMKQVVGVSTRFNIELETSAAMIGLLAQRRIVGGSAGTFTRRMFEEIYDPRSQESRRLMKHLGLTPFDARGELKKDMQVIDEFVKKMRELDKVSQVRAVGIIFDQRAKKGASELIAAYEEFLRLQKAAKEEAIGSLVKFEEQLGKSLIPEWRKAMANLEGSLVGAFKEAEPALLEFVRHLREFVKSEEFKAVLSLLALLPRAAAATGSRDRPDVSGFGLLGKIIETYGARSRPLAGQMPSADEMAAEIEREKNRGAIFRRTPSPATTGAKKLDLRFLDPQAAREALALSQAMDQAAVANMRRESQRIDQEANFAIQITEAKHKGLLISENEYTAEIERINDVRRQGAIRVSNEELQHLEDQVQLKWTDAQKLQNLIRQEDIRAKRDELLRESAQSGEIRRIRREGVVKGIQDGTSKILEKHRRDEEQRIERRNLERELQLLSPEDAAERQARFQAGGAFKSDLLAIDEELKRHRGDGAAVQALRERRRLILELRDAYILLQGEEARTDAAMQRTWGYGQNDALRAYVTAATDSAQQARNAWGTALTGLEDQLTEFFVTGKANWRDYAMSIYSYLVRIQIQRAMAGVVSLFQAPGGGVNLGSAGAGETFIPANVGHTGGIVGALSQHRYVSPMAFAGASRFHGGGLVGDEEPIIARRGEGVFTPEQMRHLAPAASTRIKVVVHNEPGAPAQRVDVSEPRFDGEELVLNLFLSRLSRDGGARDSVRALLQPPQH